MNLEAVIAPVPEECVRRICTGQVVLSLAGACKELMENALDANAKSIDILVKNYGADVIEVSDDGGGISESQFEAICLPHSTSKIANFEDVLDIGSYGFRGEALNALCSLGEVHIFTRHESNPLGFKLTFDHFGKLTDRESCSRQIGTTVTVRGVFSTLPVRRKELMRNLRREFTKLVCMVEAYALVCRPVRVRCNASLAEKRQSVVQTGVSLNLRDRLCDVFGAKQMDVLVPITMCPISEDLLTEYSLTHDDVTQLDVKLEGFISSCAHGRGRSSTDRQFISVNRRPCDVSKVCKLVNEVYHQYNRAQYPAVILDVCLPKLKVDVNVSPDKRSLFINGEKALMVVIRAALLNLFSNLAAECPSLEKSSTEPPLKQAKLTFTATPRSSVTPMNEHVTHAQNVVKIVSDTSVDSAANYNLAQVQPDLQSYNTPPKFYPASVVAEQQSIVTSVPVSHNRQSEYPSPGPSTSHMTSQHANIPPVENITSSDTSAPSTPILPKTLTQETEQIGANSWRGTKIVAFDVNKLKQKLCARKTSEASVNPGGFSAKINPGQNEKAVTELKRLFRKEDFTKLEIIGQFNLGFIICRLAKDLFIVDQHASDEKATFENLVKTSVIQCHRLVIPQNLNVTPITESIIADNLGVFRKNGFTFQLATEESPMKLTALPMLHNLTFDVHDIDEIAAFLADFPGVMYRPQRVRKILASKACRRAIMIGTALRQSTMTRVVSQLANLEDPWSCPHGRPTMRHLSSL